MKRFPILLALTVLTGVSACDRGKLRELARVDSLRSDSLVRIKDEMLNEVMTSTQFVNDLNSEIAKLKTPLRTGLTAQRPNESAKADREAVTQRVRELVARLDSSESRIGSLRSRVSTLSKRDDQLTQQVALYEKTINDLRDAAERQRAELQAVIDEQGLKIASLSHDNVVLAGEKTALTDTVSRLTVEKNAAYYIVGTRDELKKKGVIVEEGHRSFLGLVGSRPVAPARSLDPAQFVKIDRTKDLTIPLPDGEFSIVTRQDPSFATPAEKNDDKIKGSLKIDRPEKFWEPSKFLVLVRR
jgi:predicted  nucleic acid-binding Zn-ribbon protein